MSTKNSPATSRVIFFTAKNNLWSKNFGANNVYVICFYKHFRKRPRTLTILLQLHFILNKPKICRNARQFTERHKIISASH
jgi:hypothetical protein